MDMIGDSRPASGAEHLIAHYLEIMALHRSIDPSLHGLRVGTATVLMHRIYRRFLEEMSDLPWDRKTSSGEKLETVKTAFGPLFPLVQETVRKKLDMVAPPIIKERQVQKQLKEAVAEKLSVLTNPLEVLKKAQAPEHLVSLGFPKTMIREAFLFARFLRERATILDLLDQIGLLEEYVDWVLKENQGTR
jgi:glycerol-1-phosphate dehydrogenase [NAD(P)+]